MTLSCPKVLLIASNEAEAEILKAILSAHVALRSVSDLGELQRALDNGGCDALVFGWSFHRGTWNDAVRQVQQACPDLPVTIFCEAGGAQEWVDVVEAGDFDLLASCHPRTVLPVPGPAINLAVDRNEARPRREAAPQAMAIAH